jgi:hemerythrin-like domain-containing protein
MLLGAGARGAEEEREVTAVEDLMREHGILRRALILYSEAAARLRTSAADVDPRALVQTATLFQEFGEDYHERKLEEQNVFPEVKRAGGPAAALVDVLEAQHRRGREITASILSIAKRGKVAGADAAPLAGTLDAMVRMYRAHAAREDTVVFPAWKAALPQSRIEDLGEEFEKIERRQFGGDGFDLARDRIAMAERALGIDDLGRFTAPAPPPAV